MICSLIYRNKNAGGIEFKHLSRTWITSLCFLLFLSTLSAETEEVSGIVRGKVTNEFNEPIPNVTLYLSLNFAGGGYNSKTPLARSDKDGNYEIKTHDPDNVTSINARPRAIGYEKAWKKISLKNGEIKKLDITLSKSKIVQIKYVYQPDGSRNFTDGCQEGAIKCRRPNFGFFFSEGRSHNASQPDDLRFELRDGVWGFRNFHVSGFEKKSRNGFQALVDTSFESLTKAPEDGYCYKFKKCVVGQTYVVKTYKGNYAKFTVTSLK